MFRKIAILLFIFLTSIFTEAQNKMLLLKEQQSIEIDLETSAINSDTFTIEFFEYIKSESTYLDNTKIPFIWSNNSSSNNPLFFFGIEIVNGQVLIIFKDKVVLNSIDVADNYFNNWNHWSIGRENNIINISLNGKIIATTNDIEIFDFESIEFGALTNENFDLGIDEVRIWRANQNEKQLFANMYRVLRGDESKLETYYTLDEVRGNLITDKTINNRDGVVKGDLNLIEWNDSGSFTYLINNGGLSKQSNWYNGLPGEKSNNVGYYIDETVVVDENLDVSNLIIGESTILQFQNNTGIKIKSTSKILGDLILSEDSYFINEEYNNDIISIKFDSIPTNTIEFWSIPVGNNKVTLDDIWNFGTDTNYRDDTWVYSFNDGWKSVSTSDFIDVTLGISLKTPSRSNFEQTTFEGEPNNGDYNYKNSASINSYTLLGNPYPSVLNIEEFILQNEKSINGCVYPLDFVSANSNDEFIGTRIVNLSGRVSYFKNEDISDKGIGVAKTFIAQIKANENVVFNNTMRSSGEYESDENSKRLWLNIEDEYDNYSQILIAENKAATNEIDYGYDAEVYLKDDFSFYSINNNSKLAIQTFNNLEEKNIRLGFFNLRTGSHKISLGLQKGNFEGLNILLIDNYLNTSIILNEGMIYEFNVDSYSDFNDRFVVSFATKSTLSEKVIDSKSNIYFNNNSLNFNDANAGTELHIYSVLGEIIYSKTIKKGESSIQLDETLFQNRNTIISISNGNDIFRKLIPANLSASSYIYF